MANDNGLAGSTRGRHGLGLCLSGGGFRAALFHLGALRRLAEVGLLGEVRTLSAVSGGSLLAGFVATVMVERGKKLAELDWETEVATPFRDFVAKDLRTLPMLAHLPWNWAIPRFRLGHLERRLQKRLTPLRLGELPESPRFVFCATDLAFGVNWEFRRDRCGDYLAGYTDEMADWPLARALVASACFPPLLGPMKVRLDPTKLRRFAYRGKDPDRQTLIRRLSLTDGGVYDNMALEPVLKSHETIVVSDGGAPFEFSVRRAPHKQLLRYTSVIGNQAQAVRRRLFFTGINSGTYRGCYWRIAGSAGGPFGYGESLVDEVISEVRTDLDAFTVAECSVLENQGYSVTHAALGKYLPDFASSGAEPMPPHSEWLDPERVRTALKTSSRRVSLTRLLKKARQD